MAIFICKYLDARQHVVQVEIDAQTKADALAQVRAQGKPISVEEKVVASKDIVLFEAKKIKIKDISIFCKQMSVMLNSGISLNNAVDILEQQTSSKLLKTNLKRMSQQLKEGNQMMVCWRTYQQMCVGSTVT